MRSTTLLAAALCALALAAPASAAPPITTHLQQCPSPDCADPRILSGEVPSFDGAPLDVDLTLPAAGTGDRHPLMILLHGFGNNKHEWESTSDEGDGADKYHWNSHWFAERGYYVLTYTARGFRDDGPYADYQPDTPPGTSVSEPRGKIQIKSREWEIRDTQWLAALVADAFGDLDRERIAVSGGSYGGGESWLQASEPTWTFPHAQDPTLPVLKLQVAVPKYPWTDVGYALGPNGHGGGPRNDDVYESSLGRPDSDTGDGHPLGTAKASYISGLFSLGATRGVFEDGLPPAPTFTEGPINIASWNARIVGTGDPYSPEDPIVRQARRGLTEFRSAYYQDERWPGQANRRKVAVLSIEGWTDDLFTAVESFRMFKHLKRLHPRWPVEVAVADVGHSRAQNRASTWKWLNERAWQWLRAHIGGSHDQATRVSSEPTVCGDDADPGSRVAAPTPEGLGTGRVTVRFRDGDVQTNASGADDPDGPATDAIAGGVVAPSADGCRHSQRGPGYATSGYTAVSDPLKSSRTYVGLGYVDVPYALAGATATLHARLWDVAPDGGETLLMTRGTYRIDTLAAFDRDPAVGRLRLPFYGNHWRIAAGHRLRLDLQEADTPTFRAGNAANTLAFAPPRLVVPTREGGDLTLRGG